MRKIRRCERKLEQNVAAHRILNDRSQKTGGDDQGALKQSYSR